MTGLMLTPVDKDESPAITFRTNPKQEIPHLELRNNGDIFVQGRLAKNDKEIVTALKEFLIKSGALKAEHLNK